MSHRSRVLGFAISLTLVASVSVVGGQHEAEIAAARAALRAMIAEGEAPGAAVAVAIDGKIVWNEGFGYADIAKKVPATADTRFGIGSISKTITMAAALSLAEDGVLDLDAPLPSILPDLATKHPGITIRRIAAHQSGLSDSVATELYRTRRHFPDIAAAYELIRAETLAYPPGSRNVYATGIYTVIARAMELAAGKPFLEIVSERVLRPAGLTSIVPNDRRKEVPGLATYYEAADDGFVEAPPYDPSHKLPGAGFVSTAGDLARFGAALLDGRILSTAVRDEMFSPVPLLDGSSTEFALGLRYHEDDDGVVLHQPGGGIGISSWLFIVPEKKMVVALVSNVATAPVGGEPWKVIREAWGTKR